MDPAIASPVDGLKSELASLAAEALSMSPQYSSRMEVVVASLRHYVGVLHASRNPEGVASFNSEEVIAAAKDMGDYGFTLDELIGAVGPQMVLFPRRYKNALSNLLREAGFSRRQIRREGPRPLVWFAPGFASSPLTNGVE